MVNIYSKIYIAGHNGLVGSAIMRILKKKGYRNIIYRTKKQLDLKDQKKVIGFLKKTKTRFHFYSSSKSWGNIF